MRHLGRAQCQPWCSAPSCDSALGSCGGCDECASPINGMSCLTWGVTQVGVVAVLDTYFPLTVQMEQVLLGLCGPSESPLTRFAQHSAFEPKVLSIVAAFHSGKGSPAIDQLQREAA